MKAKKGIEMNALVRFGWTDKRKDHETAHGYLA